MKGTLFKNSGQQGVGGRIALNLREIWRVDNIKCYVLLCAVGQKIQQRDTRKLRLQWEDVQHQLCGFIILHNTDPCGKDIKFS